MPFPSLDLTRAEVTPWAQKALPVTNPEAPRPAECSPAQAACGALQSVHAGTASEVALPRASAQGEQDSESEEPPSSTRGQMQPQGQQGPGGAHAVGRHTETEEGALPCTDLSVPIACSSLQKETRSFSLASVYCLSSTSAPRSQSCSNTTGPGAEQLP